MNKILLPLLALILVACASPKVTVVSEVTVTSSPPTATPIPTPTLHPQFVALQEKIAASGERFTLTSDGTIEDGAKTVPGLFVDKTGAITLRGLSSQVTLDAADVSFDDENGVSVEGYTLDESTGLWEPAQETIDIGGNLSVILGEKVEGGTLIDSFVADPSLTPEQQAEELAQTDYTRVGYEQGDLLWIQSEDDRTVLVDAADHERIIAEVKRAKNAGGTTEVVWNWNEMIDTETGESILFNIEGIMTWEIGSNGFPLDNDSALRFQRGIMNNEVEDFSNEKGVATRTSIGGSILSSDKTKAIFDVFTVLSSGNSIDAEQVKKESDGTLFFGCDGVISRIHVTNFRFTNFMTN